MAECLLENQQLPLSVLMLFFLTACSLAFQQVPWASEHSPAASASRVLTYSEAGGLLLAPGLSSHSHWTPNFLALNPPHLDGIMHSVPSTSCIALWVVSLLTAAEGFTDRKAGVG